MIKQFKEEDLLKELRGFIAKPKGITQSELARRLAFSPSFINDVLNGRRDMTEALANALGYTRISYYIRREEDHV